MWNSRRDEPLYKTSFLPKAKHLHRAHTSRRKSYFFTYMRGHSSTHPNIRESDGTSCKLHRGRICFHRRHVFIGNNIYSGPRVCFILPRTKPLR